MATAHISYLGNLRTSCEHLASGKKIVTDAPTDNKGKGEAFSPTDLVATSLASCMMTIMGIYCQEHGIAFERCEASIEKHMGSGPRRIERIVVHMDLTGNPWDEQTRQKVIMAGRACPVAKTLEGNVELEFNYI
jgi:uncharacterized OsmC-like protein